MLKWSALLKRRVKVWPKRSAAGPGGGGAAGSELPDLVEEGLRLVLEAPRETHQRQSLSALMKGARGVGSILAFRTLPRKSRISHGLRTTMRSRGP